MLPTEAVARLRPADIGVNVEGELAIVVNKHAGTQVAAVKAPAFVIRSARP